MPHAFGRQRAPLLMLDDIQAKKGMLNVLGDVGSALSAQTAVKTRKGKKKASAKVGLGRTAAFAQPLIHVTPDALPYSVPLL